jgi:hypothetical protein
VIEWTVVCAETRVDGPLVIMFEFLGYSEPYHLSVVRVTYNTKHSLTGEPWHVVHDRELPFVTSRYEAITALHQIARNVYIHECDEAFKYREARPFYPH